MRHAPGSVLNFQLDPSGRYRVRFYSARDKGAKPFNCPVIGWAVVVDYLPADEELEERRWDQLVPVVLLDGAPLSAIEVAEQWTNYAWRVQDA